MCAEIASLQHAAALWAFVLAFVFGAVAQRSSYCTMGAISDVANFGDWTSARMVIASVGGNSGGYTEKLPTSVPCWPRLQAHREIERYANKHADSKQIVATKHSKAFHAIPTANQPDVINCERSGERESGVVKNPELLPHADACHDAEERRVTHGNRDHIKSSEEQR